MKRLFIAAAVALWTAVSANAQPPHSGAVRPYPVPSILCDTREQLQSILAAFGQSDDVGVQRFVELYRTINDKREPTCAVTAVGVVKTLDVIELGRFRFGGTDFYGWSAHIRSGASEGHYLYLETVAEALKEYI